MRKDGSRFWANVITMALRAESGELQGYARVVRDFSYRHQRDENSRRNRARMRPVPARSTIAGVDPLLADIAAQIYWRSDELARPYSNGICCTR